MIFVVFHYELTVPVLRRTKELNLEALTVARLSPAYDIGV